MNKLLNDKETSQILGVAMATLRKSRCTGKLLGQETPPFLKIGRAVRYKESSVQHWLNNLTETEQTN